MNLDLASPPHRRLKRSRKSFLEDLGQKDIQNPPKDLTFITDNVNGKGKKPPLSCRECRRLKLKCDRLFPCASCKKRGCTEICPDGVLVSGQGTRFILANTEQLHSKIQAMSERIRNLEDGLRAYHDERAAVGLEDHPLLRPEHLGIKSTMELYLCASTSSSDITPPSTGSHSRNSSRSSDDNCLGDDISRFTRYSPSPQDIKFEFSEADLAAEIRFLSRSFPLSEREPNLYLRDYIRHQLPLREEADYLWVQVKNNALWQYNPHPNLSFYPDLVHDCYNASIHELCPRRLALLFMILAIGCLVDLERVPNSPESERYHRLARVSLCEVPVMEDINVDTITVLFYEIWYLLVFSDDKKAAGYAWGLMGLTAKLAQSIDLHRVWGKSKLPPEERDRRRSLFWEVLHLDARLSLSLGRPPSLSIHHVDCPRPSYNMDDNFGPESKLSYQEWKHSWYLDCLAPVIDAISQPSLPYDMVLNLDRRIRDFSTPLGGNNDTSRYSVAQKASKSTAQAAVLLQLHRQCFTRALNSTEELFSQMHKYAPSVVAVFDSASRMIASLQEFHKRDPLLAARILGYWSNAHSAAVALCLLVYRAPFACLSSAALKELERARTLFRSATNTCPRARQILPILEVMINKANEVHDRWLISREVPIIWGELDIAPRAETPSRLVSPTGLENFIQFGATPSSHGQVLDPFAHAHPSLARCLYDFHDRAHFSICCWHSHPPPIPTDNDTMWCTGCPPPHRVGSPVMRHIGFPNGKEGFPVGGYYERLQPTNLSNRTRIPDVQAYFHPTAARSAAYEEQMCGSNEYTCSAAVQDGIEPSLPWFSTASSGVGVNDPIRFEFGALIANNDPSQWMAFF